MGESKLKRLAREEMLMACSGVQTMAGRVQVRWETESAATPLGQLAYFIEFLNLTGLWSRWLESCPLTYTSPNAPSKSEVLGTWLLSMLAGHRRYAHVMAIRCDGINPGLLGMRKILSEDALCNALKRIPKELSFSGSGDFVDPGLLNRFQDLFAAVAAVVFEAGQGEHPVHQVKKVELCGINVRVRCGELDGEIVDIGPFHSTPPVFSACPRGSC